MKCRFEFRPGKRHDRCNIYRSIDAGKVSGEEKGVMDGFRGSGEKAFDRVPKEIV